MNDKGICPIIHFKNETQIYFINSKKAKDILKIYINTTCLPEMYIEMYTYCSCLDDDVLSYMYASVFISEINYMKWMKCRIFITFIED